MKLPYKTGDSFALPLGSGRFARSCIVQSEHRVVVIAIPCDDARPLVVRASDEALVLQRWKRDATASQLPPETFAAANAHWMLPARVERLAAGFLGAPHPRERRLHVREILDDDAAFDAVVSIDDDTVFSLVERLRPAVLARILAAIHIHPGIAVRVHGTGAEHLIDLAATPIQRLTIGSHLDALPNLPSLRELTVIGPISSDVIAEAAPRLERLSLDANGAAVDLLPLARLATLRSLDLAAAHLASTATLERLAAVRALRLSRVTGMRDAASLASLPLQTLALEHLHELSTLRALHAIASLEQLELRALWQFEIADVEWTLESPKLTRVEIDIGGRRKNVELYKRAAWAYPWPFPGMLTA